MTTPRPRPGEVHRLPFTATSNRAARGLLSRFLSTANVDASVSQDAAIVLGELVANSLDHGRPDAGDGLEVTWRIDGGRLRLSVRDGGGTATRPQVDGRRPLGDAGPGPGHGAGARGDVVGRRRAPAPG